VLDVRLPDCDGFTLARQLRAAHAHLPVLFLTARGSVDDRIAGLTAGGDDYVTKPCSQQELMLRLKAILRRTQLPRNRQPQGTMLTYADLALNEEAHEVTLRRNPRSALADRVQPAALPDGQRGKGGQQDTDPGPGVELQLRRGQPDRRVLHQLPTPQDRSTRTHR
jgi:YesN/AraC family two-component response regulator